MINKIIVNTFKSTGKWEQEFVESTEREVFETNEIIRELELDFPFLKFSDYTIRISNLENTLLNFRLIKNSKDE